MTDLFKCITTSIFGLCLLALAIGGCGTLTGATVRRSSRCRHWRWHAFQCWPKRRDRSRSRRDGRRAVRHFWLLQKLQSPRL